MTVENQKPQSISDAEIEREIRHNRTFSAKDAMGRMAGPGAMKGASAIPPQQQADNAVGAWLMVNLIDTSGSLREVLHRQIRGSKLLLDNMDEPLAAMAAHFSQLLASECRLGELVRQADVEWGRTMGERPYFERPGSRPDPDDPYTVESVRRTLEEALRQLSP